MPKDAKFETSRAKLIRGSIVVTVLILSLTLFFRDALLANFTLFYGDSYDGIIEIAILQHWYNSFVLGSDWLVTDYFYPYQDTLGYNDTYFLPGIFFTLARLAGGDPFVAAFTSHVVMKTIGFFGMYVLLRRGASVRTWLALAGAALFTTSNVSLLHMYHAQLLVVGLMPWLTLAGIRTVQAFAEENRGGIYRWGLTFAALYGLTAFNSFYGAWFFGFFTLIFSVVGIVVVGRNGRATLFSALRRHYVPVAAVLLAMIVALMPLLIVYLPKIAEGAHHTWEEGAARTLLGPGVLTNVGSGNLVWGWFLDAVTRSLAHRPPAGGEARFGFPLGLTLIAAIAFVWSMRHKAVARLPLALAVALAAALVLMMQWPGGFTFWRFVFHSVPGADAIRVVTRFLLFALVPVIFIVITFLDRAKWKLMPLILIVGFLLLEEVQLGAPLRIDRKREMKMLSDVGAPPLGCKSFFMVSARTDKAASLLEAQTIANSWAWIPPSFINVRPLLGYRHNVDAMLIAAYYNRPTINGFSTFNPPDWNFRDAESPRYADNVRKYSIDHKITGICGLDINKTPHWFSLPPTVPVI